MHNENEIYASPVRLFLRNKWVRITLILDTLILLSTLGFIIYSATKVSNINFEIAPIDAVISVNGNTNFTNGTYVITPGTYDIQISHENLETKTFTVDIAPHSAITLTAFLKGADDNFSFYESKENSPSYFKLSEIAASGKNLTYDNDASAEKFIKKVTKILGLFELLPIKGYIYANPEIGTSTAGFAIKDGRNNSECKKIACLLINYYGQDYEDAVAEKIQAAGYAPGDYQLIYKRYNNA